MASPGELVRVVAETLGVPEAAVTTHDRNLVTAGRRTKGGRGRSAAKVTPGDAAALLIAVAGSSYVKDSVETLDAFGGLRIDRHEFTGDDARGPRRWRLDDLEIPHLRDLSDGHSFADALEALVAAVADGTFNKARTEFFALPPRNDREAIYRDLSGKISLFSPSNQASIRVHTHRWTEDAHFANDMPKEGQDIREWSREYERTASRADLRQIREFSFETLFKVGACVGA